MSFKDFFVPTRLQIRTITILALVFALVVPNFEDKREPLFSCVAQGKCTTFYAFSYVLTGFIIGWIAFYLILRMFTSLVRVNFNKTKFTASLVLALLLVLYFTIIYIKLYNKVSVFYQPSFLSKFIILVSSTIIFFMISYGTYSLIEVILKGRPTYK